jgi:hypothetical protein
MGSIRLHDRLGVNPRLTRVLCPCCGQERDGQELLLLGANNRVFTCNSCGQKHIGLPKGRKCQSKDCHSVGNFEPRELTDSERIHLGVEICGECSEFMKMGVVLISVKDGTEADETTYRTGCMSVVKDEAIERMVQPPELAAQILAKRMCFVPDEAWDALGLPRENFDYREIDHEDGDSIDSG